jgi:nickel/cobalt exporter
MFDSLPLLLATAATIGLVHTLAGPDHYVPFIAMARVGNWSWRRTMLVTGLCGVGHVLGSVVLGLVGIAIGLALSGIEAFEGFRGDIAAWLLLSFGVAYAAWGVRHALRRRRHTHVHAHTDGTVHDHWHDHTGEHAHVHAPPLVPSAEAAAGGASVSRMTPWVLFTIFVFGPCEPLIPILMYPAAEGSTWGVVLVATIFGVTTIATMTALVVAGYFGVSRVRLPAIERYSHALAGFALFACGAAIKMGL